MPNDREEEALARLGRMAALAIIGGGLLSIFAPRIVEVFGLQQRVEFLFYMFSMAAFIWALFVTFQIWQKRRK